MITIAIYDGGEFKKTRTFNTVAEMEQAFAGRSQSLVLRRVIVEAPPNAADEQRVLPNEPVFEDGPDLETGLPIIRYTHTIQEFTIEDVRANRLGRLAERYQREQLRAGKTADDALIALMIAVGPIATAAAATLTGGQKTRAEEQAAIATKLHTNKATERTLRQAIEAAQTIAEIRSVAINEGWAQ